AEDGIRDFHVTGVQTCALPIYSLACILYEVLTGKLPFEAKTPMEYVSKHVTAAPIPLSERVEGRTFPPELDAILAKALSKNPAEIGRASCRESVASSVSAGAIE